MIKADAPRSSGAGRPRYRVAAAALLSGLLVGCAGDAPPEDTSAARTTGSATSAPAATTTAPTTTAAPAFDPAPVLARVAAVAAPAGATVAAVVLDDAGQPLVTTENAGTALLSASLVKLLVVQQLLARAAAGTVVLEPPRLDEMAAAVISSDDEAMSALWSRYDGPALVRDAATTFGLTGTAPPADQGQWGNTTTTATDLAAFLAALSADPQPPGAAQVLEWMRSAATIASDGFDQRFGALSGAAGPGVAVKQGWSCCIQGRRQLHSVAVLADGRVLALLTEIGEAVSYQEQRPLVDEVTAALLEGTAG